MPDGHKNSTPSSNSPAPVSTKTPALKAAIMTSFDTIGIFAENWAGSAVFSDPEFTKLNPTQLGLDVYTWMEQDMSDFYDNKIEAQTGNFNFDSRSFEQKSGSSAEEISHPISVCDFFAALDRPLIDQLAIRLMDWRRTAANNLPIVALTTFVPEIASIQNPQSGRPNLVVRSLVNIGLFAAALNSKSTDSVKAIELVAGSRFADLKLNDAKLEQLKQNAPEDTEAGKFQIDLASTDDAIGRLVNHLTQAIRILRGELGGKFADLPPFALELEPGELFVLNDADALAKVADAIDAFENAAQGNQEIASKIGFNLDISHWRIAGLTVAQVRNWPAVSDRIAHCHVSGHHPSTHIGDTQLRHEDVSNHAPNEVLDWLKLVRDIATAPRLRKVKFSGWVSLEYEAARNTETVAKSLSTLYSAIETL